MNCANHPDRVATAFCQNCGKPLCAQCTRTVDGLVLCEPCLLARVQASSGPTQASSTSGFTPVGAAANPGAQAGYIPVSGTPPQPYQPVPFDSPSPVLAGWLGLIPGVGAMYNGQFIKALLHVVVFVILVGASDRFNFIGLLLAFWILYQVFDAAQTAAARRDGRPLPDPFGILDMSQRIGPQSSTYPPHPYAAPVRPSRQAAPAAQTAWTPNAAVPSVDPLDQQQEARWQAQAAPYVPVPPPIPVPMAPPALARRGEPIGAIVLIVVGLLFLLSTLGFLNFDWIGRGWPVLLMLLGVWLLVRRARAPVPPTPQNFQGFNAAGPVPPVSPVRNTPLPVADEPIVHGPIHTNPLPNNEEQQ